MRILNYLFMAILPASNRVIFPSSCQPIVFPSCFPYPFSAPARTTLPRTMQLPANALS